MNSISIQIKSYFFSLWSLILYIPLLIIGALLLFYQFDIGSFINNLSNLNIYLCVYIPILSVYTAQNINELEISLFPKNRLYSNKIIAVLLFSAGSVIVYMLLLFVAYLFAPVSAGLLLNYLIYTFLNLGVALLFLSALGFFIGLHIKKNIAFVLVFVLSMLMSPFFQIAVHPSAFNSNNYSLFSAVLNLLNLSYDEPYRIRYMAYGLPVNRQFLWNCLFYIAAAAFFLFLSYCVEKTDIKKICFKTISCILCLTVCAVSFIQYVNSAPNIYEYYQSEEGVMKLSEKVDNEIYDAESLDLSVTSYQMGLRLKENFKNTCKITIKNLSEISALTLLKLKLDDCFVVENFTVNGQEKTYTRDKELLTVPLNGFSPQDTLELKITYTGHVNYADSLQNRNIFVDDTSAYLPEVFAWYPQLRNKQTDIAFSINVTSKNPVVSNLQPNAKHNGYMFTGAAAHVFLLSGFIETIDLGDKEFVVPEAFVKAKGKDIEDALQGFLSYLKKEVEFLPETPFAMVKQDVPMKDVSDIDRYMFIPFSYNLARQSYALDNTAIINEYILGFD